MIRFSASLVVVALGLLVAGGVTSKLLLVYVAIAVSAIALVFLIIGAILNRGELRASSPAEAPGDRLDEASAGRLDRVPADHHEEAAPGRPDKDTGGAGGVENLADTQSADQPVTVVPGVPRYHRSDCILIRFMGDSDLQKMPVEAAKKNGCTPCRACHTDGEETG